MAIKFGEIELYEDQEIAKEELRQSGHTLTKYTGHDQSLLSGIPNRKLQPGDLRKDGSIEAAIEVFCKSQNDFLFMEKIQALEDVEDVTLIQYNGEYHG